MGQYKIDFGSIPWESPMQGLRYKASKQNGKQLRLVEYTRDMEPHWCEKGHIGYVLQGRFEIKYETEIHVYNPGDGICIPAGKEHRHMGRVLSETVSVVFVEDA
jgi:quercetin dioxygenase-like cupin family protein